jgi:hypothetical protein
MPVPIERPSRLELQGRTKSTYGNVLRLAPHEHRLFNNICSCPVPSTPNVASWWCRVPSWNIARSSCDIHSSVSVASWPCHRVPSSPSGGRSSRRQVPSLNVASSWDVASFNIASFSRRHVHSSQCCQLLTPCSARVVLEQTKDLYLPTHASAVAWFSVVGSLDGANANGTRALMKTVEQAE